jgi:Tfp pilus assembly protein PilN
VVEMRTQELHRLREERARHLQQLDELEETRNKLSKMSAKVEDMQEQLDTKSKVERWANRT